MGADRRAIYRGTMCRNCSGIQSLLRQWCSMGLAKSRA